MLSEKDLDEAGQPAGSQEHEGVSVVSGTAWYTFPSLV